tara:strand:+ start:243 stop:1997 length:1755 start_codon:yes stop_codon:yes gene_type:complete
MLKDLKQLTNKSDRFNLSILFILLLIATIVEMIGIGSVPIFAMVIVEPDRVLQKLPYFLDLDFINEVDKKTLTLYTAIILFLIFLFKNIYLGFLNFFSGTLIKKIKSNTYNDMFSYYIKSNYEFHISRNSADLIRNITTEVSKSVAYITSFILLAKEILIVITIFIMLVIVDSKISFLIFILLGIFSLIFFFLTRKGTKERGRKIQEYWGKQIKALNHGLGSIKQTKILNKEKFMSDIFKNNTDIIEKNNFFQNFLVTLPRLFLELMAILVIVIVSITFVYSDRSFENFVPLIALITVSAVRLIPSFNTISQSIATMRYFSPSFQLVSSELKIMRSSISKRYNQYKNKNEKKFISFKDSLEVKNLTYYYPGTNKKIIDEISFKINHKDIIGIVGSSGEGKSTLIDLLSGLLKPSSGNIIIDGVDINENSSNWQQQIGYVPQDIYLLDDSIKANIAFGVKDSEFSEKNFIQSIKLSQLDNFVSSLPDNEKTLVGDRGIRLSGGQRQRIGIARSLYFQPNILIFDEPTSSLDVENEKKIMNELYSLSNNLTVIIISHRYSVLEKCKKIIKIKDGKITEISDYKNLI